MVKFFWIPASEPFLGTKSAKFAAERGTNMPFLTWAQKTLQTQKSLVHTSVGKFTQSINSAIQGSNTNLLYYQLCKEQAKFLAQLRTGKSRLNDYLSGIGEAETDQCTCGTWKESIRHFLFYCPKWTRQRQGIRQKAAGRWRDLSYVLGGKISRTE